MLGNKIAKKAFISNLKGFADLLDPTPLLCRMSSRFDAYSQTHEGKNNSNASVFFGKFPILGPLALGAMAGQYAAGNAAGFLGATLGTLTAVGAAVAVAGPVGAYLIGAGLMATGAAAHLAAPLVRGLMGKDEGKPQGLCAKILHGMADGLWTPVMGIAYVASKIGQGVGLIGGAVIGAAFGATAVGISTAYEHTLKPLVQCAPVQNRLARANQRVGQLAERGITCAEPEYSNNAHAFGQRLRARFAGMTAKRAKPAARGFEERHKMDAPPKGKDNRLD